MDLSAAKALLPIARQLAGLASDEWSESYDTAELRAEICIRDAMTGEIIPIAILTRDCAYDDRQLMIKAPLLVRGLLTLFDAACDEIRRWKPADEQRSDQQRGSKNYAAECAMKCDDQAFRRFLAEHKGQDVSDDLRVKNAVRFLLKVDSRNELNHDAGARNRWLDLRAEFEQWMRVSA